MILSATQLLARIEELMATNGQKPGARELLAAFNS